MIEKEEKLECFQDELGHIKDVQLRKFAEELIIDTDDWFFIDPASTSGKYHPQFSLGEGGLVNHTRAVVYWLWELYRSELFSLSPREIELLNVAAIAHDIKKHNDGKFVSNHARMAHDYILEMQKKYPSLINLGDATYIGNAILTHMGVWGKRDGEKAPETNPEKILHFADLIASRREMSLDFLVDKTKHAPIMEAKQPKAEQTIPLVLENPGQCEITFGKHKGKTVEALYNEDKSYLEWIEREENFGHQDIKTNIIEYLNIKRKEEKK